MKRLILSCVAIAALVSFSGADSSGYAQAQNKEQAPAAAPATHKVGLIDMAYLFSQYDKFKDMREELRGEIESRENNIKAELEDLKTKAEAMKQLKQGSDEQAKLEKSLTAMQAKIEADKQTAKRELFRQESKIYQAVYGEVTEAVSLYAKHYNYTLILRFTREEDVGDDPAKVMQALQRQVVYNQAEDDITVKVLSYLNKQYKESGKIQPTSGVRSARKPAAAE